MDESLLVLWTTWLHFLSHPYSALVCSIAMLFIKLKVLLSYTELSVGSL